MWCPNDFQPLKCFCEIEKIYIPFILGSVIADTMKFAFLFFEFYIPYVVGFWILFGGPNHAETMGKVDDTDPESWEKFNDLMFSVWSVSCIIHKVKFKIWVEWL